MFIHSLGQNDLVIGKLVEKTNAQAFGPAVEKPFRLVRATYFPRVFPDNKNDRSDCLPVRSSYNSMIIEA